MNNTPSNKPLLFLGAGIAVMALLGLVVFSLTRGSTPSGKVPVTVYLVPTDTALTVDGQATKAGKNFFAPGKHQISASRSGFTPVNQEVDFAKNSTDSTIDLALEPETNDARVYAKDHYDLYAAREGRGYAIAEKAGKSFNDLNPIVKQLPFSNFLYSIGYSRDPSDPAGNKIIIEIDSPVGYRNGAIEKIRSFGFDPTDFNIIFRDYQDPFTS